MTFVTGPQLNGWPPLILLSVIVNWVGPIAEELALPTGFEPVPPP
ncbi:MAG: hypothetical protein ACO20K_08540 [Ilumatobacteraceae bacterium]